MSTLIREDSHGTYVKVGGYIARPVFPRGWSHVCDDGTEYEAGQKVTAKHPGGPTAKVGDEIWYLHGCYMEPGKHKGSEDLFKPDYEEWPK